MTDEQLVEAPLLDILTSSLHTIVEEVKQEEDPPLLPRLPPLAPRGCDALQEDPTLPPLLLPPAGSAFLRHVRASSDIRELRLSMNALEERTLADLVVHTDALRALLPTTMSTLHRLHDLDDTIDRSYQLELRMMEKMDKLERGIEHTQLILHHLVSQLDGAFVTLAKNYIQPQTRTLIANNNAGVSELRRGMETILTAVQTPATVPDTPVKKRTCNGEARQ
jgi:hypothetical protein